MIVLIINSLIITIKAAIKAFAYRIFVYSG